jgi:hypothetical protein
MVELILLRIVFSGYLFNIPPKNQGEAASTSAAIQHFNTSTIPP